MFVMCYCNLFIQFLLDMNILKFLEPLVEEQRYNSDLMVQVYRLLSKILAGTQQQIQVCLSNIFSLSLCVCVFLCMCVYVSVSVGICE